MNRVLIATLLLATLAGTTACTDTTRTTLLQPEQPMQISSIHWDEVAAADRAASVNNNGLIMMR